MMVLAVCHLTRSTLGEVGGFFDNGIFIYVHLGTENHFQPNQIGKSRIGAFQRFLHCKNARFLYSKNTGFLCSKNKRLVFQEHRGLVHKVLVVQEHRVLVMEGSCIMKNSLGGGEQVPPAFFLFSNRDPFLHRSPGGGEQVPPAVLVFQNRHLFYTSPGGVVQVASGGSIF